MPNSTGKRLRLAEFCRPETDKGLLFDTSVTGCMGYIGELINAKETISIVANFSDGIILNPGQFEHISSSLPGKRGAAPIMRLDWTNFFRDDDFPLPVKKIHRVMIAGPEDALRMGANAVIMYFFLGFDEEFESKNIEDIADNARKCEELNMPLIVDIRLAGPKIDNNNISNAIKLGVGFMVEGGADSLIIPYPGSEAFKTLLNFSPIPLFLHSNVDELNKKEDDKYLWQKRLTEGAYGFCLGSDLFDNDLDIKAQGLAKKALDLVHNSSYFIGGE